mmetsp:Transcript_115816/g.236751  ORF Transcript_115816/g.236751 Transcript_115816/m.236751 type:complete len:204 (-) Transcript_115816:630-1241(-)
MLQRRFGDDFPIVRRPDDLLTVHRKEPFRRFFHREAPPIQANQCDRITHLHLLMHVSHPPDEDLVRSCDHRLQTYSAILQWGVLGRHSGGGRHITFLHCGRTKERRPRNEGEEARCNTSFRGDGDLVRVEVIEDQSHRPILLLVGEKHGVLWIVIAGTKCARQERCAPIRALLLLDLRVVSDDDSLEVANSDTLLAMAVGALV